MLILRFISTYKDSMFEQPFKNIDDVLWEKTGCSSEVDSTAQTAWMLFLKSLDDPGVERAMESGLQSQSSSSIIDESRRWSKWAAPGKVDVSFDHDTTLTGDDLIDSVKNEHFPCRRGFQQHASFSATIKYKSSEIFGGIMSKFQSGHACAREKDGNA